MHTGDVKEVVIRRNGGRNDLTLHHDDGSVSVMDLHGSRFPVLAEIGQVLSRWMKLEGA